jgi:hypothetical protein
LGALIAAIAALSCASAAAAAAADVPQCPGELAAASVQVRPAPGWSGVVPTRLLLSGAGVVIGPPDASPRAELRGDARRINRQVTETAYPGLAAREAWLTCAYGVGGELEQVFRLPLTVERCVVRVSRSRNNNVEVAVSCTPAGR